MLRRTCSALLASSALLHGPSAVAADLLHARVTDVPADAACRVLSELSGESIAYVGASDQKVTFSLHGVTLTEALREISSSTELEFRRVGTVTIVYDRARRSIVDAMKLSESPRISLHVEGRSLLWVLQAIARVANAEIAYFGEPRIVPSLHLIDVPWEQALDIIAAKYALRVERRKGTISLRERG